ncbi:hypothetical protein DYU11_19500 [Fibrisoma montanum]|uniref:DUF1772 domain-containing protein n=1 Tax=Fibrisoma montanum TaxID=2305895 RepID=A0A418M6P3_9BACT|nr:hypothetical protein [Fibrisoma montanum]RIV21587.1 hypothetical protein DYU11_19500 [Fibrisoma montanum]
MRDVHSLRWFLGFTLFGLAHWFFGNLYETVAFTPNTLADPATALTHWNAFTKVTNPVWYFVPMSPLTFLAALGAYWTGRGQSNSLRRSLLATLLFTSAGVLLTVYIVTQINLKVFFSGADLLATREQVNQLVWRGMPWGIMRLICIGAALATAMSAYNRLLRTGTEQA